MYACPWTTILDLIFILHQILIVTLLDKLHEKKGELSKVTQHVSLVESEF